MLTVDEHITSVARLRELLPTEGFTNTFHKVTDHLNDVARQFIATVKRDQTLDEVLEDHSGDEKTRLY